MGNSNNGLSRVSGLNSVKSKFNYSNKTFLCSHWNVEILSGKHLICWVERWNNVRDDLEMILPKTRSFARLTLKHWSAQSFPFNYIKLQSLLIIFKTIMHKNFTASKSTANDYIYEMLFSQRMCCNQAAFWVNYAPSECEAKEQFHDDIRPLQPNNVLQKRIKRCTVPLILFRDFWRKTII